MEVYVLTRCATLRAADTFTVALASSKRRMFASAAIYLSRDATPASPRQRSTPK